MDVFTSQSHIKKRIALKGETLSEAMRRERIERRVAKTVASATIVLWDIFVIFVAGAVIGSLLLVEVA